MVRIDLPPTNAVPDSELDTTIGVAVALDGPLAVREVPGADRIREHIDEQPVNAVEESRT